MNRSRLLITPVLLAALGTVVLAPARLDAQRTATQPDVGALADRVFSAYTPAGPGCTVGVAQGGRIVLERAYGLSDLESGTPLSPTSIIEAGSVSKQFTAAAVTLLALEGKLRFDDDVRKHFPELPAYERPITVRMLLDHTSGLRDWGSLMGIAGWPRGTRAYTHPHVLEIIARQRSLNYPPGDQYSYTNSGYNLLAMLVERVSGQPFPAFTKARLFDPAGMTRTSWRDDFRRVVPGRAQGYQPSPGGFRLDMPFENVFGNGGLLTTVGDLLRWNEVLTRRTLGGALVDSLERQGVLTSGERISYAAGLVVDEYRGTPRIGHSGATAGYRAYLARYPAQDHLSVAVLCNTSAPAGPLTGRMVDGIAQGLAPAPGAQTGNSNTGPSWQPTVAELERLVGVYESDEAGVRLTVALNDGRLWLHRAPSTRSALVPAQAGAFQALGLGRVWFTGVESGAPQLHVGVDRVFDLVFTPAR
ncbi:MAG: beta-lactamase family protein [Gemmatimonadetes bacterium]|nr:beta-lactamase family protein [Gemmatimonadota bacterium]